VWRGSKVSGFVSDFRALARRSEQGRSLCAGWLGNGHELTADPSVLPFLVRRGFHPRLGAGPMRDAVEKAIGDAVANELLTGGDGCGKLSVVESGERLGVTR